MLNMMQTNQPESTNRQYLSLCRKTERGVVLLIALIVLVAMTLAGVALVRSTYTTNLIAGNLAFSQAATQVADIGTEKALTVLRSGDAGLYNNPTFVANGGYSPVFFDPEPGTSWQIFWEQLKNGKDSEGRNILPKPLQVPVPQTATDFEKNYSISYVIHRLCDQDGAPNQGTVTCAQPPKLSMEGESQGIDGGTTVPPQVYYRITVRVDGPRNTQSYIQTVVAI